MVIHGSWVFVSTLILICKIWALCSCNQSKPDNRSVVNCICSESSFDASAWFPWFPLTLFRFTFWLLCFKLLQIASPSFHWFKRFQNIEMLSSNHWNHCFHFRSIASQHFKSMAAFISCPDGTAPGVNWEASDLDIWPELSQRSRQIQGNPVRIFKKN